MIINYKDKFKLKDKVWYGNEKATIVHIHGVNDVNIQIDGSWFYIFNVHPPTSLKLIKHNATTKQCY